MVAFFIGARKFILQDSHFFVYANVANLISLFSDSFGASVEISFSNI
jgi:hypothetical protein